MNPNLSDGPREKIFYTITRKSKIDCINKKIKSNQLKCLRIYLMDLTKLYFKRLDQSMIENITIDFNKELYSKSIIEIYREFYLFENQTHVSSDKCKRPTKNSIEEKNINYLEEAMKKNNIFSKILKMKLHEFVTKYYLNSDYFQDHLDYIKSRVETSKFHKKYFEYYKKSSRDFINYFFNSKGNEKKGLQEKKKKMN